MKRLVLACCVTFVLGIQTFSWSLCSPPKPSGIVECQQEGPPEYSGLGANFSVWYEIKSIFMPGYRLSQSSFALDTKPPCRASVSLGLVGRLDGRDKPLVIDGHNDDNAECEVTHVDQDSVTWRYRFKGFYAWQSVPDPVNPGKFKQEHKMQQYRNKAILKTFWSKSAPKQ
jgi:hypothetical protein